MNSTKVDSDIPYTALNMSDPSSHQKKSDNDSLPQQFLLKVNTISLSGTSNGSANFQSKFYVYETISGARLYIKEDKWNSMQVCPADVYISKYMEQIYHSDKALQGKNVLTISAGCGLVCMVTAMLGAISSGAENSKAIELLTHNIKAFNAEYHRTCHPITVRRSTTEEKERCIYDIVICSDSFYNKEKMAETLESLIFSMNGNSVCYLIHTWRNEIDERDFFNNWVARIFALQHLCSEKEIQEFCSMAHASKLLRTQSTSDIQNSTDKDGKVEVFKLTPVEVGDWISHAKNILMEFKNFSKKQDNEILHKPKENYCEKADKSTEDKIKKTSLLPQLKQSPNASAKAPQNIGLKRPKLQRETSKKIEPTPTKNVVSPQVSKKTAKPDATKNIGTTGTKVSSGSMNNPEKSKFRKALDIKTDLQRFSNMVKKVPK